jgi:hypothetical protein
MEIVMGYLDEIGDWIQERAIDNLDKAYSILGARPGPGIDINIHPTADYLDSTWRLVGETKAGKAFIAKFWADPTIYSNKQLVAFKRQCDDWGLKFHVIINFESLENEHKPQLCVECGKYYADSPSDLCPGCEAYQEHIK